MVKAIELIEKLSLEYVHAKATSEMTPTDLLNLYNEAYSDLYPQIMPSK